VVERVESDGKPPGHSPFRQDSTTPILHHSSVGKLGIQSRVEGLAGIGEDGAEGIANGLEDAPAVALDTGAEQVVVLEEGCAHGLGYSSQRRVEALRCRERNVTVSGRKCGHGMVSRRRASERHRLTGAFVVQPEFACPESERFRRPA